MGLTPNRLEEIMMPKNNALQHPAKPCWVRRKDQLRLAHLPKPTGAGPLGAATTAHLCAVFLPGTPHAIAAAAGALIGLVIGRFVPTFLIYLSSAIVPAITCFSLDGAEAIMEMNRVYLPIFGVIAGFAVALRCGAWLYDRSPIELVLPAPLRKKSGPRIQKTRLRLPIPQKRNSGRAG
jgi:hypothetical protein